MRYPIPGQPGSSLTIKARYDNFIGGEWVRPAKGRYFENLSPITGKAYCEIARSDEADVNLALDAAHGAKERWGKTPAADRANLLNKIADRMEANLEVCRGDDAVTDQVLRSLVWHLDRIVDLVDAGASPTEAEALAVDAFAADWKERCGELDELVEVLGPLGDLLRNARWNTLRGVLQSAGWQEVVRVRRALERMPELVRLIRRLGRERETGHRDASQLTPVQVARRATATRIERRETHVPDLLGETRGVRRSGRVARMLPSEAALLAHPRLRLVWHARHAERTLLTYEDDDRVPEVLRHDLPVQRESALRVPGPRRELGPMLLCVDTSGSMQGGAEVVAKAVVLEAVRTASAERRACHVFAFGGPGEVVEMSLGVDADGVERLTRWMGQSFGGGTDIGCPLERALARLDDDGWRLADLLIASDGEFGATPAVAAALARAKEDRGLRVQGVLIGDRETLGMLELADEIFWVHDWRRFGEASAGAAAPTLSRTATYFPGAVRTPGKRQPTHRDQERGSFST